MSACANELVRQSAAAFNTAHQRQGALEHSGWGGWRGILTDTPGTISAFDTPLSTLRSTPCVRHGCTSLGCVTSPTNGLGYSPLYITLSGPSRRPLTILAIPALSRSFWPSEKP